ncbi:MAG: integrase core domain-containing protein [Methylococcales bacterium]
MAEKLIRNPCTKQRFEPGDLTLHAARGSSLTSKPVAFLLADLGVTKTPSRPRVSNHNPFSEAQFKTLKYRPTFPKCFGSLQAARAFCQPFLRWYNTEHRHSGIAFMTPESVHSGHAPEIVPVRRQTLELAFALYPQRFKGRLPVPKAMQTAVWINPPNVVTSSKAKEVD